MVNPAGPATRDALLTSGGLPCRPAKDHRGGNAAGGRGEVSRGRSSRRDQTPRVVTLVAVCEGPNLLTQGSPLQLDGPPTTTDKTGRRGDAREANPREADSRQRRQGGNPSCRCREVVRAHGEGTTTRLDRTSHGAGLRASEPQPCLRTGEGQQGSARGRRHVRQTTGRLDQASQARTDRLATGWQLPTAAGARGANPQARRQGNATIGHSHGGGPPGAAGDRASAGADP